MTRLHVRYDGAHFPEDLVFQETGDRSNFQGRYILRHAWTGNETCSEADAYRRELSTRREKEAQTLARPDRLGHQRDPAQTGPGPRAAVDDRAWWQRIWPVRRSPGSSALRAERRLGGVMPADGYANPQLLVTPASLHERIGPTGPLVIDFRPAEEFARGAIPGAVHLDLYGVSLIDTEPAPMRAFLWIIEHLLATRGVARRP